MKKTTKQNLFLLLAVTLLASGLYFIKQKSSQDKEIRLPISTQRIETITIEHASEIKLEKKDDNWFMTSPKQGQVKPERIEKMLTHLMLPLGGDFPRQKHDLALYGLDKPRMQVTLNDEILAFGALNTMQQMHYIGFREKVYLARPFLQISFDQSVEDLLVHTEHK